MSTKLGRQLYDIYESLRTDNRVGFLTDEDFQKYFLGLITYKYLSENLELYLNDVLSKDNITFEEAYSLERYRTFLEKKAISEIGYFLRPNHLFRNIVSSKNYGALILNELEWAFVEISSSSMNTESQEDFEKLFENVNLKASQLGKTDNERNEVIFNILKELDAVDFGLNEYNSSLSLSSPSLRDSVDFIPSTTGAELKAEAVLSSKKNIFLDDSIAEANILSPMDDFNNDSDINISEEAPLMNEALSIKPNLDSELSEPFAFREDPAFGKYDEDYKINRQYSIGDAFVYLLDKFSLNSSLSGDFFTPSDVSLLVSKLIKSEKNELNAVYDPCCGSASLLLEINKIAPCGIICGQELNAYYYNIARENMILHNIHFKDFAIKQGDSLLSPQHINYKKFDAVVSQIPFNAKWAANKSFLEDERFNKYNALAPRAKGEYAFIQHMLYHLKDDGIMIVIAPHGVLFRSASEESIRKSIIGKFNYLDAVIGLPSNIFYSNNSPACLLVFKKNRSVLDDILFIDASSEFEKIKLRNNLRDKDIDKIVDTYANRKEIKKYSRRVLLREIDENEFNLNIPRYVDTYDGETIDPNEIYEKRKEVIRDLDKVTQEIEDLCKELNIKNPLINEIFDH